MKQYETFIFDSYGFDPQTGEITLRYALDDEIAFEECITVPGAPFTKTAEDIAPALFALHLAGGVSYYKTCCPGAMEIRSGGLTKAQAKFWNTVYEKGLGEFFYQNQIDFRGLIRFPTTSTEATPTATSSRDATGASLVPIGGGKDSIVTIERLRADKKKPITLLRVGDHHPLIEETVRVSGLPCLYVDRQLSSNLFALNEQGALNGHIPITAYISALSVVLAELIGFDDVVFSNEQSANEGNVEYLGQEINHQWSKSTEFEQLFADYIQNYIDPTLRYYSALRDLTEFDIVREFVQHPQYFHCVSSCNRNWNIAGEKPKKRWCGTCPKCTFVFALVAAHAKKDTVLDIFEQNMFADSATEPLYKQLLGYEGIKPFECVGTPTETQEAFALIAKRGEFADTPVMHMYQAMS